MLRKLGELRQTPTNPKYIPKPYEKMLYPGQRVQKDMTFFEAILKEKGIRYKLIRPYTPCHNGKVERSHKKDNEYFYATHSFYSFDDFEKQLAVHSRKYNNFPMHPLHWHSPREILSDTFFKQEKLMLSKKCVTHH